MPEKKQTNDMIELEITIEDILDTAEEPVYFPEEEYDRKELSRQIDKILETLTPREEKVIRKRFGIGEGIGQTLEEVGQDFEVTRERARQIEKKALNKLRHPSRSRHLRDFIEGLEVPKIKSIPGKPRFTFPVFAKHRRIPSAPFVPAGITTFPDLNMTAVPEGFDTVRLMVPFSKNLGAFLPINFSSARTCPTLPALFKKSQNIAIKNGLIKAPGLTEEEWIEATQSFSRTDFSTGPVQSSGKRPLHEDSLFDLLAIDSNKWRPRRGFFICEELQVPLFHEIETLEYETGNIRSLYFTDFFKTEPDTHPAIHFQIKWNLFDQAAGKQNRKEWKDLQSAKKNLLPWIQENVLSGFGLKEDHLNNYEWYLKIENRADMMASINTLERLFPHIKAKYLELIDAATAQRKEREEAINRENQKRWRKEREEEQKREENRQKEREEYEKRTREEFFHTLDSLDPLKVFHLGFEYEFRSKNIQKAIYCYQTSARKGCPEAQYQLSQKYLYGDGVTQSLSHAVQLLVAASDQGLPAAQYALGRLYEFGKGVLKDPLRAISLYHRAGRQGHTEALITLGNMYEKGKEIPVDLEMAEKCYEAAINHGSPGAVYHLTSLRYRRDKPQSAQKDHEFI